MTATAAFVVRDQLVRSFRADTDQNATLAAGRDGHVALDEEGQPAEHLLLGDAVFGADQGSDPVRQVLVVGHATSVRTRTHQTLGSADSGRAWSATPAR